jgi:hypothetical protein
MFLGPWQIRDHLLENGFPIGVHAISREDTCKWVALDLDRHSDDIPPEALEAARDAVIAFTRDQLGLTAIVENSGGGWHLWVPFGRRVRADQAFRLVKILRQVGETAWGVHHPVPKIDFFPRASTHWNGGKNLRGYWLRLPGHHHKRDHRSSLLLPDGSALSGLAMWQEFERVAKTNAPVDWENCTQGLQSIQPGTEPHVQHAKPKSKSRSLSE